MITVSAGTAQGSIWGARSFLPVASFVAIAALLALFGYGLMTQRRPAGVTPGPNAPAPNFHLTTFDGRPIALSDYRGRPVVVNFWASWCVPCRDEQSALDAMSKEYLPQGVQFIGVNMQDSAVDGRAFVKQFQVPYPVALDQTGAVYIDYGVVGVPETYFITRSGTIQRKVTGPLTESEFRPLVEELMR